MPVKKGGDFSRMCATGQLEYQSKAQNYECVYALSH
ncbi:DNA-3-methyladenine glycosidase [Kluyvera sp. Nf5]|nr:DNA-3-methyladenine glycosidase [Kluyvera sp. Nf5]